MSLLPATIPARARRQLADAVADTGVTVGEIKPGTRVTLLADHQGTAWELTYIGQGMVWRATGPGSEHGVGLLVDEIAAHITAAAEEPAAAEPADPFPAVPRTYLRVPVPQLVRADWRSPLADGWRLGVRCSVDAP